MKFLLSWLKEFVEMSLPPETLAERLTLVGCEVTGLTKLPRDWLFEAEMTPNRPDLLSHFGIARETAAALGRSFRTPRWLNRETRPLPGGPPSLPIAVDDADGCHRYVGIVIEGVKVSASPPEVVERLTRLGIRPVNNIVDATNLCLMELGQPLHAFDLDRLRGPAIQVRRAEAKEMLVAIDGTPLTLKPGVLVIADAKRPVALAGVMGGRDTEITSATKRVLLESAWFEPNRIRESVKASKLSSDSSYRFERGVDPAMVQVAAIRAARLICRLAGGTIPGSPIEIGTEPAEPPHISLRPRSAQEILGMQIYPAQQKRFLERLGCKVTGTVRMWKVQPPSWRPDLKIPEDLYEEMARLWGYDRCPATLAPTTRQAVDSNGRPLEDPRIEREARVRQLLKAAGLQEIMTYSLISPDILTRCQLSGSPRMMQNPLSVEQSCLRPSLLPGALEAMARNSHRKAADSFSLFELGRIYEPDSVHTARACREDRTVSFEKHTLGILMAGTPAPSWGAQSKPLGLFHAKGVVEFLCHRLALGPFKEAAELDSALQESVGYYVEGSIVTFRLGERILGSVGLVDPKILAAYEIPAGISVAYAELDADLVLDAPAAPLAVRSLPKVPPVERDLAIVLPEGTLHEEVLRAIQTAGAPLLQEARLFDLYKGKQVSAGKISMAFRLQFSDGDRTLTDEEVATTHQKILKALETSLSAVLR